MTPLRSVLDLLEREHVKVTADGDALELESETGSLSEEVLDRVRACKSELLAYLSEGTQPRVEAERSEIPNLPDDPVERYRALLWRWYELTAGADPAVLAPVEGGGDLVNTIWQAERALAYAQAQTIRRDSGRLWFEQTNRCPTCGELGVFHDRLGIVF